MARVEFRKVVRGVDGLPVEDAEVSFFEPGTATPIDVFATINAASPVGQPVTSDENGVVLAYLTPGVIHKIVTEFDAITDTIEHYGAADPVPPGPWVVPYRDADGNMASRITSDGQTIREASPVTDALRQFLPGGTFNILPAEPTHRWLKVSDFSNPLSAGCTLALDKSNVLWAAGDTIGIVKGDSSDKIVTIGGLDDDGAGIYELKRYRDFVLIICQTTTGGAVRFERGPQGRINPTASDVSASGSSSGLAGANVQAQLDELAGKVTISATSLEWSGANPVLPLNVRGFDSDTRFSKTGDGVTAWDELPYDEAPSSSGIPVGTDALVRRNSSGDVELVGLEAASLEVDDGEVKSKAVLSLGDVFMASVTTARTLAATDRATGVTSRAGQLRSLPVNLSSPGTMAVPAADPAGAVYHLVIDPSSSAPTIAVVGDVGSVNGTAGGSVELIPGTEVLVRVTGNPGSAPVVRVIGGKGGKTIYGNLVGADNASALPNALSGFNILAKEAPEKTASFVFDASHANLIVPANHATVAIVATIPANATVAYPIGTLLAVERTGAAAVSMDAAGGVTFNALEGRTLAASGQGFLIGARKRATDEWRPVGAFAAS